MVKLYFESFNVNKISANDYNVINIKNCNAYVFILLLNEQIVVMTRFNETLIM